MDNGLETLRELVASRALEFGEFELSSGGTSSVYVDIRQVSLTGRGAQLIGAAFWDRASALEPDLAAVGGMTLGADPLVTATTFAAAHRDRDLSGIIVRKSQKEHGTRERLEAPDVLTSGARVVALDDTVTTGGSILEAIEQMRAAGFSVRHALAVVDREAGARAKLDDAGIELHALFRLSELRGD